MIVQTIADRKPHLAFRQVSIRPPLTYHCARCPSCSLTLCVELFDLLWLSHAIAELFRRVALDDEKAARGPALFTWTF